MQFQILTKVDEQMNNGGRAETSEVRSRSKCNSIYRPDQTCHSVFSLCKKKVICNTEITTMRERHNDRIE